ncbi:MAG: hypothetical protein PW735_02795 [Acidobacteriaceae bacterium]|nr:hypothetical protein [Acidobacteriaceae bacterium]
MRKRWWLLAGLLVGVGAASRAEPLPSQLEGSWRVTRILAMNKGACWTREQAAPMVGSVLSYHASSMRWRGGEVEVEEIDTRDVSAQEFTQEANGSNTFAQLGIHTAKVLEVDMQHEDMDITGATTEVPGDSVLMAGPGRIVVSACGVYFEARRTGTAVASSAPAGTAAETTARP